MVTNSSGLILITEVFCKMYEVPPGIESMWYGPEPGNGPARKGTPVY